ncbi:MAG: hypothetical protein KAJ10_04425, partial [Thermodesulfovibrionia bacterium]|nr:hypothetical protein [Thermodesulfovibrionia bacterium]
MWQKAISIVLGLLLIYIIIIPLLFCTNIDFNFSQNPEYISCSQDSDCKITSCGCLNNKTVFKCGSFVAFSNLFSGCLSPSSCSCQDGQCVGSYDYDNDIQKEVSLTTDKTEYQTGEEVKLTVRNNLDEEIEFYNIMTEKFNSNEWEEIRFDIECLGLCEKFQTVINSKNNRSFYWDQKDSIGLQTETGKFRFRIKIYNDGILTVPPPSIYYSNKFTIKNDSADVDTFGYCENDDDCYDEAFLSGCDCKYYCLNKNDKIAGCAKKCDAEIEDSEVPECICWNNKCVDKKFLSTEELSTEDNIQSLINQMGDDNVSQKIKNAIPEKLYDYGKEAIPYLIEALDDERVFDACYELPSGYDGQDCVILLVKQRCNSIINQIITPNPSLNYKYSYYYKVGNWQQWWNENQDKSLNEIRKMV